MTTRIREILDGFRQRSFIVIGDLLLDHYAFGSVNRISPEAPIQVLDIEKEEYRLGGAANVAHNLANLGARVELAGVVGEDASADIFFGSLAKARIGRAGVISEPGRPTTVKSRLIAQGDHLLRTDREVRFPISVAAQAKVLDFVASRIETCDAVVLSDYAKGVLGEDLCRALLKLAGDRAKKVFVGPKGKTWTRYRSATLISANRAESELVSGIAINSVEDAKKAAQTIRDDLEAEVVVITLGARGMYVSGQDGSFHMPAEPREVYDVAGAGDTVLSLFSLAGSISWKTAARMANAAAGIVVGKVGTSAVTAEELEADFSHGQGPHLAKIKTIPELLEQLNADRDLNRAVAFTNGCFDILHPGHVRYLEYCKSRGDILVVGINSDASVQKLKGKTRPIVSEQDRAEMLAALSSTDYIVIFDESTPASIISRIRPDILIKGSDWKDKGVVGREFVESYGGKVELYEIEEGYSSSKIIEKILSCSR